MLAARTVSKVFRERPRRKLRGQGPRGSPHGASARVALGHLGHKQALAPPIHLGEWKGCPADPVGHPRRRASHASASLHSPPRPALRFTALRSPTTLCSQSGAEGIRTPDLRRAKSEPYCRGCSLLFKNTCKSAELPLEAFVGVRRRSRGLVYYWCTQEGSAPPRPSRGSAIAESAFGRR